MLHQSQGSVLPLGAPLEQHLRSSLRLFGGRLGTGHVLCRLPRHLGCARGAVLFALLSSVHVYRVLLFCISSRRRSRRSLDAARPCLWITIFLLYVGVPSVVACLHIFVHVLQARLRGLGDEERAFVVFVFVFLAFVLLVDISLWSSSSSSSSPSSAAVVPRNSADASWFELVAANIRVRRPPKEGSGAAGRRWAAFVVPSDVRGGSSSTLGLLAGGPMTLVTTWSPMRMVATCCVGRRGELAAGRRLGRDGVGGWIAGMGGSRDVFCLCASCWVAAAFVASLLASSKAPAAADTSSASASACPPAPSVGPSSSSAWLATLSSSSSSSSGLELRVPLSGSPSDGGSEGATVSSVVDFLLTQRLRRLMAPASLDIDADDTPLPLCVPW
ncbi:hypothetical protein VTK73DRAFT_5497 [Phialemonium thermophilum]|uniref:Uncharacterized protein n=1 Tax=Phialemonium thermophilum TaxID=223376 RepID=A0ABR3V1F9_9PEZI